MAAPPRRSREASLGGADGVVVQVPEMSVRFDPPPRPLLQRKLRDIFVDVASTPPVQAHLFKTNLGKGPEGLALCIRSAKRPSFAIKKEEPAREAILQHPQSIAPSFST